MSGFPLTSKLGRVANGILEIAARAPRRRVESLRIPKAGVRTPLERQAELRDFYDHFEEFVDVLCDAARLGATDNLCRKYEQERSWFGTNYCGVRPFLISYLPGAPSEDPFDRLIQFESLTAFLSEDDGGMIHRIEWSRYALSLYAEHLRQLVARNA